MKTMKIVVKTIKIVTTSATINNLFMKKSKMRKELSIFMDQYRKKFEK